MALIESLVTKYASHQIYLERLASTEGAKAIPYIKRIQSQVGALLADLPAKTLSQTKQNKIIEQIRKITLAELKGYTSDLKANNKTLGAYEAEYAAGAIDSVIETEDYVSTIPKTATVNAVTVGTPLKLGDTTYTTYTTYINTYYKKYADQIEGIATAGFQSGRTNQQVANQIMSELRLADNLEGTTALTRAAREAKTIARTSMNHVATSARIAFGEENQDVIIGYRSIATMDNRTSKICRAYDNEVRKPGDKDWGSFKLPRHPNERSSLAPEVNGKYRYDDSDTKRPSNFQVDGKRDPKRVSSKQTYYEGMSKLNAADQDTILGPTLGKAFRKMDNPEQFAAAQIDSLGRPLSITQMRQKDNELARILNG